MSQTEHWFNKTACSSRSRGSSSTTGHQIHDQSPHAFLAEVPIHAVGNARPAPTGSISMIGASHHPYRHAHPLCDLEAAVRATQEAGSAAKAQYEEKLAAQQDMHRIQLDSGQQRIDDAQRALEDARSTMKGLEEQIAANRQDMVGLKEELRAAKLPSPVHKEALDALQAQNTALRENNTELVLRARAIDARYRTGDLV